MTEISREIHSDLDWWNDPVKAAEGPQLTQSQPSTKKCVICHTRENITRHHALFVSDYPQFKGKITNRVPLCKPCHDSIHNNENQGKRIKALEYALANNFVNTKMKKQNKRTQVPIAGEVSRHMHPKCPFITGEEEDRPCLHCKLLELEDRIDDK